MKRSISLRDRMLVASVTLAAIVIGVFVALILALSALHSANKQEARSKKVTASALTLDRLVLSLETGLRGTYERPGHKQKTSAVQGGPAGAAHAHDHL